jgi:hypothetical protein
MGFLGMGFVVLFLTIAFSPAGGAQTWEGVRLFLIRLVGLILVALMLVVAIAGVMWRARGRAVGAARQERRDAWTQRPAASAFDYPAAQAVAPPSSVPSAPPTTPPGGTR